eukprot:4154688-Pyramimonas_sp.AAC.1
MGKIDAERVSPTTMPLIKLISRISHGADSLDRWRKIIRRTLAARTKTDDVADAPTASLVKLSSLPLRDLDYVVYAVLTACPCCGGAAG